MKILFADKFPLDKQSQLTQHSITNAPELNEETLAQAIGDAEILVVRSTKVTAQAIDNAPNLKLIIRAGAGTNTIDKAHAAAKNIAVCNTPGKNAIAVAELAMGLMLAADRHIPAATKDLQSGQWNKKRYSVADGIYGKSVGIIGFGAIGQAFAERAQAFGMRLHTVQRNPDKTVQHALKQQFPSLSFHEDLQQLAKASDVVSVHLPLNDQTRGLINADFLSHMKNHSVLINTARGEIVDETALLQALDEKSMKAGLDVFCDEPSAGEGAFDCALAKHPNVVSTHHIGASTQQAQNAVAENVIDIIEAFEKNNQFINRVN